VSTTPTPGLFKNLRGKVDPEVASAIDLIFKGTKDAHDAIVALSGQHGTTVQNVTNNATTIGTLLQQFTILGESVPEGNVNQKTGPYPIQNSDYGGVVILQGAGPYDITLNSAVSMPYYTFCFNFGAVSATVTPDLPGATINNVASLTLQPNQGMLIFFDGLNWWAPISVYVPGGSDTQVQFNDGGTFGGDPNFTWDKVGQALNVNARLNGYVTGNVQPQAADFTAETTLNTGGTIGSQPDIEATYHIAGFIGAGSVGWIAGIFLDSNYNSGGGTLHRNDGLYIGPQNGVGDTFNRALHIADQGTGANDWAIKVDGGKSEFNGPTILTSPVTVSGLLVFANNAAALAGGLVAGQLYRTGADPDLVAVVH